MVETFTASDGLRRRAYGQVCTHCGHAGALHRLEAGAPSLAGLYACRHATGCSCTVGRDDLHPLTKSEFLARFPDWPAPLDAAGLGTASTLRTQRKRYR